MLRKPSIHAGAGRNLNYLREFPPVWQTTCYMKTAIDRGSSGRDIARSVSAHRMRGYALAKEMQKDEAIIIFSARFRMFCHGSLCTGDTIADAGGKNNHGACSTCRTWSQ